MGIILFTLLLGLLDQQTNDDNPRLYDFKGAIERIQADATPKALVLYEPPDMRYVMEYYAPELRSRPLRGAESPSARRAPGLRARLVPGQRPVLRPHQQGGGQARLPARLLARFETPQTKVWEFR